MEVEKAKEMLQVFAFLFNAFFINRMNHFLDKS